MAGPDLRAVDELCRLAVAARRLGCRIHLSGADADLRALLEVAGVDDVFGRCPADPASETVPASGSVPASADEPGSALP